MLLTASGNPRRLPGFIASALLHGAAFCALMVTPQFQPAVRPQAAVEHKYSVLVLNLKDLHDVLTPPPVVLPRRERRSDSAPAAPSAAGRDNATPAPPAAASAPEPAPPPDISAAAAPATAPAPRREFVAPPAQTQAARVPQTLIQPDVPPDVHLSREVPLPTIVMWAQMPKVRRQFVAPVATPKPNELRQVVPVDEPAPELQNPRASVKIPLPLIRPLSTVVRPPASTPQTPGEAPRLSGPAPGAAELAALISLPKTPFNTAQAIAIPPANQIAAAGDAKGVAAGALSGAADARAADAQNGKGSGSTGSGSNSAAKSPGTGANGADRGSGGPSSGASGSGALEAGGAGSGTTGNGSAAIAGLTAANGSGPGRGGSGGAGTGRSPGTVGSGPDIGALDIPIPGTTRLTMPRDGKYGVIVAGSSVAGPYAEAAGALSGKMVYSVYVSVGLRKKWILEYCLPRAEEQKSAVKGRAPPIDAPWPYVIVRPDEVGTSNRDYMIVHGQLNPEGRFEQLALLFPNEIKGKQLLLDSLHQWTFRPASRDGEPTTVEVLLIIPNQPE